MKVYFEDSGLKPNHYAAGVDYLYAIDAGNGYTFCKHMLDYAKLCYPDCTIYTNSIIALSNEYCWNDIEQIPELYLRDTKTKEFVRVDKLTDKELRKPHNLMHMYLNNGFRKSIDQGE